MTGVKSRALFLALILVVLDVWPSGKASAQKSERFAIYDCLGSEPMSVGSYVSVCELYDANTKQHYLIVRAGSGIAVTRVN